MSGLFRASAVVGSHGSVSVAAAVARGASQALPADPVAELLARAADLVNEARRLSQETDADTDDINVLERSILPMVLQVGQMAAQAQLQNARSAMRAAAGSTRQAG